jgi:hypothetical protein
MPCQFRTDNRYSSWNYNFYCFERINGRAKVQQPYMKQQPFMNDCKQKPYVSAALLQQFQTIVLIQFIDSPRINDEFALKPVTLLMNDFSIDRRWNVFPTVKENHIKLIFFLSNMIQVYIERSKSSWNDFFSIKHEQISLLFWWIGIITALILDNSFKPPDPILKQWSEHLWTDFAENPNDLTL